MRKRRVSPFSIRVAGAASAACLLGALGGCSSVGTEAVTGATSSVTPHFSETGSATAVEWATDTFGTFEEFTHSGTGEQRIELPAEISQARSGIIEVVYDGAAPLTLWSENSEGELFMILIDTTIDLYAEDPAQFDGETMWWWANEPPSGLHVDGDGQWDLTVRPIDSAPPLPSAGVGLGAYLYDGVGGTFTGVKPDTGVGMSITEYRSGSGGTGGGETPHETVSERTTDVAFHGELAAGPSLVFVTHRGSWEIDLP